MCMLQYCWLYYKRVLYLVLFYYILFITCFICKYMYCDIATASLFDDLGMRVTFNPPIQKHHQQLKAHFI